MMYYFYLDNLLNDDTHHDDDDVTTADELNGDEVAIIFSFLPLKDIMRLRRVCSKWKDAAKKTIVPPSDFVVDSVDKYRAMATMTTALPNLQHISICNLGDGDKYSDGEDPNEEEAAETANLPSHDIDIISNFRKLRSLEIYDAPLNGRYPSLFNFPLLENLSIRYCSRLKWNWEMLEGPLDGRYPVLFNLPLLQKLTITYCNCLKWDLGMLEGLPSLKELDCDDNSHLNGSLSSLRVLKDTLEKLKICDCPHVRGNFMDLADFPRLKNSDLRWTNVTGDIRDIGAHDFPVLGSLSLPDIVHGGIGYEFQNVSDVPEFMHTIHLLLRRTPKMFERHDSLWGAFDWRLSQDSPDWYDEYETSCPQPPFNLQLIEIGSRLGWSWCTEDFHSCEIHWLDPEPSSNSRDYETYIKELQNYYQHAIDFYRGYYEPPTQEVYNRIVLAEY